MSFPSGHAAAAGFLLSFVFHYLNQIYRQSATSSLNAFRFVVILLTVVFTIFCCATRITDYWHFPTDVTGGFIYSILIFYLTLRKYK